MHCAIYFSSFLVDVLGALDDIFENFDFNTDMDLNSISPHSAYSGSSLDQTDPFERSEDIKDEMLLQSVQTSASPTIYKSPVTTDPMLASDIPASVPLQPKIVPAQPIKTTPPTTKTVLSLSADRPITNTTANMIYTQTVPQVQQSSTILLQSKNVHIVKGPSRVQQVPQVLTLQSVGDNQVIYQTSPAVMYTTSVSPSVPSITQVFLKRFR